MVLGHGLTCCNPILSKEYCIMSGLSDGILTYLSIIIGGAHVMHERMGIFPNHPKSRAERHSLSTCNAALTTDATLDP